jgi:hypothetical protein
MTKEAPKPNDSNADKAETAASLSDIRDPFIIRHSSLEILSSFGIRHSSFSRPWQT